MSDVPTAGGEPPPMAVRLELVREYLIDRVHDAVRQRGAADVPPELTVVLDGALEHVSGAVLADAAVSEAAAAVARAGYETRVVEREQFEPARQPAPGLREALEARLATPGTAWAEAAAAVASELARAEPLGRPRPDDPDAVSWRVPGPGGHVRHYLALRFAEESPPGALGAAELKRSWLFGFLICCCEEAFPPS